MAVYYKFKSARDYDSIAMDGPFISVGILKEKIFESKHLGRGTDFDLVVTNAQTNEEYLDDATLIPKNTSVLIRRVPGRPRMPIVTDPEHRVEDVIENTEPEKTSFLGAGSSVNPEPDWDDLGGDLYEIPEVMPVQPSYAVPDIPPTNKADEDSKLKALIDTPVLDWQHQGPEGFGPGRGFGRGMNGRMGGRGFGRTGVFEKKTPPQGYICHRCKVPGHFIQHCPTNGDPNYDIKRVKAPTGIPRSMLQATPEGSYALPSGAVAVLRPNEAAFEKEIEGLPSTRSVGDLPPELHCPLCKEVMKDAVLTSKCCFKSFCDKCIRNYITSKSVCVCGDTNTLADDLLPNKTLRDAINRILESGNSSTDNAGSAFQVQDMESARCPLPKIPSPTLSAASKGENQPSPLNEALKTQEIVDEVKPVLAPQQMSENVRNTKIGDASEATHESMSVKEPASQGSAPLVDEEVQQRLASVEAGKKRKKKKVRMPANEMQWKTPQDLAAENYMMHMGPSTYNPYWNGMQPGMGMDGYMPPYGAPMPYMGYGMGPMDMPFGGPFPPDSFGGQGYMMPMVPPQRDLADFGMGMGMNGMNVGPPPIMSREEFEARKADLRRKRENERPGQREFSKDRDYGREVGGDGDVPPMKSKSKSSLARSPSPDSRDRDHHRHHRYERSSPEPRDRDRRASRDLVDPLPPPRPPKRKPDHHHDRDRDREREPQRESAKDHDYYDDDKPRQKRHRSESSSSKPAATESAAPQSKPSSAKSAAEIASAKSKASVFSRISFPEGEGNKKRKSSPAAKETAGGGSKEVANGFHDHEYSKSAKVAASAAAVSTTSRKSTTSAVSSPAVDYESSDDDRHFKRKKKSSRYAEASPQEVQVEEEPSRHSRGSRDREREHRRQR
ncbi:PREDICTED: E3 ubiquitin-protein ligase RBBP6-like isoform X2 [Fragaria vesca subsp. vesca]|uniref:E3 ubiquitin-protein ligase RBBP6-like isoform X2 n=1 Tax=Fragaria vesca subsp. vesca TaxID=101020 RepID=UPI0002C2F30E|nr:PREDICTED: E3 ubiquitin-protein ligase RBBP6-like isoform X2 [Fragaria vesca subsp. vesca]